MIGLSCTQVFSLIHRVEVGWSCVQILAGALIRKVN